MHVFCRIFFFQLTVAIFSNAAASKLRESFAVVIKRAQAHLAGAETAGLFGACQPAIEVLGHALPENLVRGGTNAGDGQAAAAAFVRALESVDPFTHSGKAKRPFEMHLGAALVARSKHFGSITKAFIAANESERLFTFATVSNRTMKLASVKP